MLLCYLLARCANFIFREFVAVCWFLIGQANNDRQTIPLMGVLKREGLCEIDFFSGEKYEIYRRPHETHLVRVDETGLTTESVRSSQILTPPHARLDTASRSFT